MDTAPTRIGPDWATLFSLARSQRGLVTIGQAERCEVGRSTLRRRADVEGWLRPFPRVYALPGVVLTEPVKAVAAGLAIGPPAVVTGRSALGVHGVTDLWPVRVQVVVPEDVRRRAPDGIEIRRSVTLREDDVVSAHGVELATIPRALLDASATSSRDRLRTWLIDARQRRLTTIDEVLHRALVETCVKGRRRLLQACEDVQGSGADSTFVRVVEEWLAEVGIAFDVPPRVVQTPSRLLHPDITLAGLPVAIEADGFGAHATRRTLERDQRKHNAYLLAGWIVLRIGWQRFREDRAGFLHELRVAMAQAAAAREA